MSQKRIWLTVVSLALLVLNASVLRACTSRKIVEHVFTQAELEAANTAVNEKYLSTIEKEVFYYLNLARSNPKVFASVYVKDYEGAPGYTKGYAFDERKESLLRELESMSPLSIIKPDRKLFDLAECFAIKQGKKGKIGHSRKDTGCASGYHAECCSYGDYTSGLHYVLALLIDAGESNGDLGHRRIMLGNYLYMGVAHRDHAAYGKDIVLDFWRSKDGK